MKQLLFVIIALISIACNNIVADGPLISFTNQTSLKDTIIEDDMFSLAILAEGKSSKITQVSISLSGIKLLDTLVNVSNFIYDWNAQLIGYPGSKTLLVTCTDENDLIASRFFTLYIKALKSPTLTLTKVYNSSDTIIFLKDSVKYRFECLQGDRKLDSLKVIVNNQFISAYTKETFTQFSDSSMQIDFSYKPTNIGEYEMQWVLKDVIGKSEIVKKKITVK